MTMTLDKAIALATRLHPNNDILASSTDTVPTLAEALELIRNESKSCGFNWLTGAAAEESLQAAIASRDDSPEAAIAKATGVEQYEDSLAGYRNERALADIGIVARR